MTATPPSAYTIVRHPFDGSPETTVYAANAVPGGVVADSTNVYFADTAAGTHTIYVKAHGAAPADPPSVLFTTTEFAGHLALRDQVLYWHGGRLAAGRAWSRAIVGGTETNLTPAFTENLVASLAVTSTTIYWSTFSATAPLRSIPIAGGTPVLIPNAFVATSGNAAHHLIATDSHAYWFRRGGSPAENGIDRHGPDGVEVVLAGGRTASIAIDSDDLYYVDQTTVPATLFRIPVSGGVPQLIASPVRAGEVVASDGTFLYGIEGPVSGGTMHRYVR